MSCARTFRDAVLVIKGGGSGELLTIPIDMGDLEADTSDPAVVIKNRGAIHSLAKGEEEAMTVRFSAVFDEWRGETTTGATVSIADALRKQGNASAWTSTATNSCGPYAVDLELTITNPDSTGEDEVLTFPGFHADRVRFKEGMPSSLEVEGICPVLQPASARA
jgi:hypothetical protein